MKEICSRSGGYKSFTNASPLSAWLKTVTKFQAGQSFTFPNLMERGRHEDMLSQRMSPC